MTVAIVTDSACDLPQDLADAHGITIVPLTIRFGDEEFVDRRDLTAEQFWARCSSAATLPETAAVSVGAFEEAFRAAAAAGADGVVAVLLSGGLSSTAEHAVLASKSVTDIPVVVVDSRNVSAALGLLAVNAARLAAAGKNAQDIAAAITDQVRRTKLYATMDTLENLRKGGRIGRAQAVLGSVLSMKPVIELIDGEVEAESRQRTRSKSMRHLIDLVHQSAPVENLMILHSDAPDLDELVDGLSDLARRDEIVITRIGAVIGTHAGPRAIGVAFQTPAN